MLSYKVLQIAPDKVTKKMRLVGFEFQAILEIEAVSNATSSRRGKISM